MTRTSLAQANRLLRQGHYEAALELYAQALRERPALASTIEFNMSLARRRSALAPQGDHLALIDRGLEVSSDQPPSLEKPNSLDAHTFDLIKKSALFDVSWYFGQYQDRYKISGNPLEHYLIHGVQEGLNPSLGFDTRFYLERNPDVLAAGVNPLVHYACQGRIEGRQPIPFSPYEYSTRYIVADPEYIPRLALDAGTIEKAVRAIAFYLPQFHPIVENNQWWGEGFTEWTNVRPAQPQFEGHYQPHVPDEFLGYYDLRDKVVMQRQIELAKQYGIEGFCFYLYWFAGKRLLELPLDNYLNDPSLDLSFCVCWANENWTRRWDGLDHELLMVQQYSDEDDLDFIQNIAKYLRDSRYVRIDGKPLLLVYRPNLFPDMKATARRWREWCRGNAIGEIYLVYPQSFECVDPEVYGFDAAVEFPPNNSNPPNVTGQVKARREDFQGRVFDWRVFLERSERYQDPGYKLFRGVCPSWDNTARKKSNGTIFHQNCPKLFRKWLTNAFTDTWKRILNPDERVVFINAWNEWAEGAHLEPDRRYGYAWLQAVRDAHVDSLGGFDNKVLVVTHDCHPHGAQYLILATARKLRENGFQVWCLALKSGRLIDDFQQIGRVVIAEEVEAAGVRSFLEELRAVGVRNAITSTVVCGSIVPCLKDAGFRILSLIHELPGVIRDMQQEGNAASIAEHADKLVFPAEHVRTQFETIVPVAACKVVIRPQGLLRRNPYRTRKDEAFRLICNKHSLPEDCQIVLNVAFVDHRKGADLFVEMADRVLSHLPNTVFIWVGHHDPKMWQNVTEKVSTLRLRDRILFVGFDKEPLAYYAAASVFALTSREDPFPNVVLEAAEVDVPVVCFAGASGAGDYILERGGRAASYGDVGDYAEKVIELLQIDQPRQSDAPASLHEYALDLMHHLNGFLRVSVVVPNYNYSKYIVERLETICSQTYPVYQLVVIDDASSDDSVPIIRDYLDHAWPEAQLLVNASNSGSVFRQWRKGAESCSGDLLWIAEADDLSEKSFVSELVKGFSDPDLVMAYCQSKQMDTSGNFLAENYLEYTRDVGNSWESDYARTGLEELSLALCVKNTIPNVSAVLFRKVIFENALRQVGEKLFEYKVAGDWIVYMHVLKSGNIYFNHRSLNKHRRHEQSVTKSTKLLEHFSEVCQAQRTAADIVELDDSSKFRARKYIEKLRHQFRLADS
ncbi:MAG: glycoside hydrolase family 99-like domain-containing protein [Azonexus sp.]